MTHLTISPKLLRILVFSNRFFSRHYNIARLTNNSLFLFFIFFLFQLFLLHILSILNTISWQHCFSPTATFCSSSFSIDFHRLQAVCDLFQWQYVIFFQVNYYIDFHRVQPSMYLIFKLSSFD